MSRTLDDRRYKSYEEKSSTGDEATLPSKRVHISDPTPGQKTSAQSIPVVLASDQSAIQDIEVSGTITTNGGVVDADVEGRSSATVVISGTYSSFIALQGSIDGSTFSTLYFSTKDAGYYTTVTAVNGNYLVSTVGLKTLRVISAFFSSGTISVFIRASDSSPPYPYTLMAVRSSIPTFLGSNVKHANSTFQIPTLNEFGNQGQNNERSVMAHWGKNFRVTTNFVSASVTLETAIFLFRVPSGSISCKIHKIGLTRPVAGEINYRIYKNSTPLINGTSITNVGSRTTGQASSVALCTSLPTMTSNGSIFWTASAHTNTSGLIIDCDNSWIFDPSDNMLITVQQSAGGAYGSINVEWTEI